MDGNQTGQEQPTQPQNSDTVNRPPLLDPSAGAAQMADSAGAADKDASVSTAEQFQSRKRQLDQGEKLQLSGGLIVRVRRPSITRMVQAGVIPANVAGSAIKMDSGKNLSDNDVRNIFAMKAIVLERAFLEPKLVIGKADYSQGDISYDDLTEDEINDVYQYVQVGLEALTKFREKRQRDASRPDSSQVSGDETE